MKKITKAVILNSYRPKKDKSVSLSFETMEQSANDIAEIHSLTGMAGVLYFRPEDQLTKSEVKELDALELEYNGKSKSRRLKDVLYRVWQQTETPMNEKEFYAHTMDVIIQHYKNKLE